MIGRRLLWILAGLSAGLLVYEAWILIGSVLLPLLRNPNAIQTDFHYYYQAAERFSLDRTQLYSTSDDVIAGFAYPPPAIVPFMVMTRVPLGAALLVLTLASYAAITSSAQRWLSYLRRHEVASDRATQTAILLIVLASGPVYMNAIFGQVNAFVLLSAVVFVTMAEAAPVIAGASLAAGIALKIYPIVTAAIVLWNRRAGRALLCAALAGIAIVILLLPIVPPASYRAFLDVLSARVDKTAIHIINQSLAAVVERFNYPSELYLNWTGHQAVTVSPLIRGLNYLMLLIGVSYLWKRFGNRHPQTSAAGLIALMAVIAPLGWGHTYLMVLPLVILQLINLRDAPPLTAVVIFLCVAGLMIPAGRHLPIDSAPEWMENLVYSRYLIATLVMIALK